VFAVVRVVVAEVGFAPITQPRLPLHPILPAYINDRRWAFQTASVVAFPSEWRLATTSTPAARLLSGIAPPARFGSWGSRPHHSRDHGTTPALRNGFRAWMPSYSS
jgi:hypothetical protein